jgi:hypothetical protein
VTDGIVFRFWGSRLRCSKRSFWLESKSSAAASMLTPFGLAAPEGELSPVTKLVQSSDRSACRAHLNDITFVVVRLR